MGGIAIFISIGILYFDLALRLISKRRKKSG
jgi:hypothetical protein